jgi:hypothetical protein
MRRSIVAPLLVFVISGAMVTSTHAGSISGTLSGDATLTSTATPNVYVQNFSGEGDDTILGAFTAASTSTVDFSNPPNILITDGMITETFSQGTTLFGTSSGSGTANGHGSATVSIDFVITGGTGFLAGATGEITITATITSTSATTETITGTYSGTLSSVPEPGTLTLLGPAIAVGAFAVRRNRKPVA